MGGEKGGGEGTSSKGDAPVDEGQKGPGKTNEPSLMVAGRLGLVLFLLPFARVLLIPTR